MQRVWALVGQLPRSQRKEHIDRLKTQTVASELVELLEAAGSRHKRCPHCAEERIVRNGSADGLQRYKCRGCGKAFNALTGTPLSRLRLKGKWFDQTGALADGLTVHRAAERLGVAPSTAFHWRHRFLAVPRGVKPAVLAGVAEIDETYVLESFKGQKVVGRSARKRGLSREQIPFLVARDRSGSTADYLLADSRKGAIMAVLKPLLPADAVLCTDGGGSIGQAVKDLGLEHHPVVTSKGRHAIGAWPLSIQRLDAPLSWRGDLEHGELPGLVPRPRPHATCLRTTRAVAQPGCRYGAIIGGLSESQSPRALKLSCYKLVKLIRLWGNLVAMTRFEPQSHQLTGLTRVPIP